MPTIRTVMGNDTFTLPSSVSPNASRDISRLLRNLADRAEERIAEGWQCLGISLLGGNLVLETTKCFRDGETIGFPLHPKGESGGSIGGA